MRRGAAQPAVQPQREGLDGDNDEPHVRRWNEVFDDPVLTGAIVDRIAHKAHVVDMTGESYRVIETKEWIEKANRMMG